jgi:hypothetical protein
MHPKKTYLVEELFEDIPGDPDNVILKLPQEICDAQGWIEGTKLDVTAQDGALMLRTHVE